MPDFSKLLVGGLIIGGGILLLSGKSKSEDTGSELLVGSDSASGVPESPLAGIGNLLSGFFSSPSAETQGQEMSESPSQILGTESAFQFDKSTLPVLQAFGNVESLNRQLSSEVFTGKEDVWGAVFDVNPQVKKNLTASEVNRFMEIPFTGLNIMKSSDSSGAVTVYDEPNTILQRVTGGSGRGGGVSKKEAESNTAAIKTSISYANEFRSAAKASGVKLFGD